MAAASQLKCPELLTSVQQAFVKGMDTMMLASACIAVLGVVLSLVFLPNRSAELSGTVPSGETAAVRL